MQEHVQAGGVDVIGGNPVQGLIMNPNQNQVTSFHPAHEDLHAPLGAVRDVLQEANDASALVAALESLNRELTIHFDLEESEGRLNDAVAHAPQMMRAAGDLLQQHATLSEQGDCLLEHARQAAATRAWWSEFSERVDQWIHQLVAHEAAEQELLAKVFELDD